MTEDPYRVWLQEFYQDVDTILEKKGEPSAQEATGTPPSTEAREGTASRDASALRMELDLLKQQTDASRYQDLLDKYRRLAEERSRLEEEFLRLQRENADLKRWQTSVQKHVTDMRMKVSIAQEGYEAHLQRLQAELIQAREARQAAANETESLKTKNILLQGAIDELRTQLKTRLKPD